MTGTAQRIKDTLASVRRDERGEYADTDSLTGVGLDSLSLLELLVRLEKEFSVQFEDSEVFAAHLVTVGDLVAFVERRLSALPADAK